MQCTSFFPGHYPRQDLNGPPNGGPWSMYTNDTNNISLNTKDQSYNNFCPSRNIDQIRIVYHNEVLRQTMLRHENVFREQVQELHRLHRRQRELMDEFKRRGLKEPNVVPTSHYNFTLSKVSSDCSTMTWQTPMAPTLPWLNPATNKVSTPGSLSPLSAFNFLDASPQNENGFENSELLPKCKKPKRKMLDLELPGDEYIDSEEENDNKNVNMLAFDLNVPPIISPESEIFPNLEIKSCNKESPKYLIDLNSFVDEDEPSPTLLNSKNIDLEAPVSPQNKESLPPRGGSEEDLLEAPIVIRKHDDSDLNYDLVAAETILSFKSASLIRSLDWFAGVVVSSGSEKEETECVVALPSQQGKRQRKRRMNRKLLETETFCSISPLMSYDLGFGDKGLKSWGKVNKRRRRPRVPASSIRVSWN